MSKTNKTSIQVLGILQQNGCTANNNKQKKSRSLAANNRVLIITPEYHGLTMNNNHVLIITL